MELELNGHKVLFKKNGTVIAHINLYLGKELRAQRCGTYESVVETAKTFRELGVEIPVHKRKKEWCVELSTSQIFSIPHPKWLAAVEEFLRQRSAPEKFFERLEEAKKMTAVSTENNKVGLILVYEADGRPIVVQVGALVSPDKLTKLREALKALAQAIET